MDFAGHADNMKWNGINEEKKKTKNNQVWMYKFSGPQTFAIKMHETKQEKREKNVACMSIRY